MLILGGGLFGCTIALYIKRYFPKLPFTIVDPHETLLERWYARSTACGMQFLRSPASHCIDPSFTALLGYARRHNYDKSDFQMPYWRPSLRLFNAFLRHCIDSYELEQHHLQTEVRSITRKNKQWIVDTQQGKEAFKAIILAPGRQMQQVTHGISVFDQRFSLGAYQKREELFVFGAGMSGVQVALSLTSQGNTVQLLSQYPVQVQQFDSNPCYIGPKCGQEFFREKNMQKRRAILKKARYPGSITPQLYCTLQSVLKEHPENLQLRCSSEEYQHYTNLSQNLAPRRVIIAHGFTPTLPLQDLITSIARNTGAAISDSGVPISDDTLEWHEGLFLTGMLAELVVGPAAQNIIGAHLAAQRILPRFTKKNLLA